MERIEAEGWYIGVSPVTFAVKRCVSISRRSVREIPGHHIRRLIRTLSRLQAYRSTADNAIIIIMDLLVWEIVIFVISSLAVLLNLLGLPGNFVPAAGSLVAVLTGNGTDFTWMWFFIFLMIAVSGEILDQIFGAAGAKKTGAGRAGMWGAALGGFLGGILGSMFFPVIGSVIGVFVGCFALTFLFEYFFSRRDPEESIQAGIGAVLGKAAAIAYKFIAGFVLLILMAWRFWAAG